VSDANYKSIIRILERFYALHTSYLLSRGSDLGCFSVEDHVYLLPLDLYVYISAVFVFLL